MRLFLTMKSQLIREALLFQLFQQDDLQLVGESATGVDTLRQLEASQANVLVIEEDLADNDGLTVAEIALTQNASLNVLLLVDANLTQQRLAIYLEAGIKSVVTLNQPLTALFKALHYVRRGQVFVDAERYRAYAPLSAAERFSTLSEREQEVAQLLAQRMEAKAIAEHLGVSYKTVHSYKDRIFVKMGFERLPELVLFMNRIHSGVSR